MTYLINRAARIIWDGVRDVDELNSDTTLLRGLGKLLGSVVATPRVMNFELIAVTTGEETDEIFLILQDPNNGGFVHQRIPLPILRDLIRQPDRANISKYAVITLPAHPANLTLEQEVNLNRFLRDMRQVRVV